MARNVRLESAGEFYHAMARGNLRQPIFRDEDRRRFWLAALAEACGRQGLASPRLVLLDNHLFLDTPEANPCRRHEMAALWQQPTASQS